MEKTKLSEIIKKKIMLKEESKIPELLTFSKKYISIFNDELI